MKKIGRETTGAYVHPIRGMGDTNATGRLLASGTTYDVDFPIWLQSVSGHRLPITAARPRRIFTVFRYLR